VQPEKKALAAPAQQCDRRLQPDGTATGQVCANEVHHKALTRQ
jgi:hypothetical protein